MDFCSKYGYNYGFEGSDSEEYSDEEETVQARRKKKVRKADTNIIAVKFDRLVAANEMFAGEPKSCKHCGAFMSYLSPNNVVKEDEKLIWKCEFCEQSNDMTLVIDDINEVPKKDDVTFMLELPKPKEEHVASAEDIAINEVSNDDSFLSFCIDISGSMNSNIQNSGFTRLNGVQSATVDAVKKLKDEEPNRRASLVTFSEQVKYFGDCTANNIANPSVVINRADDLNNKERISTLAYNAGEEIKPIKETHALIEQKIKSLRTEGSTALGPALLFCVELVSKKAGSSIILCTDGCANVGIGSVESRGSVDVAEKFYEEIAEKAKEKGVIVNVVTMEGTDCKLALLRKVADVSNGQMNIVNPLNLKDEFKSIVENRIVATSVVAKLIVSHRYLYIRDDKLESEEGAAIDKGDTAARELIETKKKSIDTRNIGNCSMDSEITFEYGLRKLKNEKKEELKKLPFQLQITYSTRDGTKAVRCYTKELEFTTDRKKAESNITAEGHGITFSHHSQMMSKQYLDHNIFQSKCRNMAANNLYSRAKISAPMGYQKYSDEVEKTSKHSSSKFYTDRATNESYMYSKMSRMKMTRLLHESPKLELIKDASFIASASSAPNQQQQAPIPTPPHNVQAQPAVVIQTPTVSQQVQPVVVPTNEAAATPTPADQDVKNSSQITDSNQQDSS